MNFCKLIAPLFLVFLIACGSASAPPISLPAPLTGKVTISSPDDDGYIHVDGTEGAVDGGRLVMAINDNTASASLLEKGLDSIVRSAYAGEALPDICSETGYACDEADTTGAFSILIPGEIGHVIIVVIIDPVTGEEISERLLLGVPDNVNALLYRPLDMVGLVAGYDYILFESNQVAGRNSIMMYFDETEVENYVDLGALGARNVYQYNAYSGEAAALGVNFVDDALLYFNDPNMQRPLRVSVADPTSIAFLQYTDIHGDVVHEALVTMKSGNLIKQYNMSEERQSEFTLTAFGDIDGCDFIMMASFAQQELFILACRHSTSSGSIQTGFTLVKPQFNAEGGYLSGLDLFTYPKEIPDGYSLVSISQLKDDDFKLIKIMASYEPIDGSGAGVVAAYDILATSAGQYQYTISDPVIVSDPAGWIKHPGYLLPVSDNGGKYAFVLVNDGDDDQLDHVVVIDVDSMSVISRKPVGLSPVKANWTYEHDILNVLNFESRSFNQYTLEELLAAD